MVLRDIWSQKCQLLRVVCHWRGQESISSIGGSMPCDPSSIVIYINSVAKEVKSIFDGYTNMFLRENLQVSSSERLTLDYYKILRKLYKIIRGLKVKISFAVLICLIQF